METELLQLMLRIGLGATFVLTGWFILESDDLWSGLIRDWVLPVISSSKEQVMRWTAYFDVVVGMWLMSGIALGVASVLAALHLLQVLLMVKLNEMTYRDVGLFAASVILVILVLG